MIDTQQKQVIQQIKKIMKKRKITYQELSQGTEISESSLKKIFSGSDCSFSRIFAITNFLDISFYDLIHSINQEKQDSFFQFSLEQEVFFSKNIHYYLFFHKIFRDNMTIPQVQKQYSLSEKEVWKILRKLEEFSLLEIVSFPQVKFMVEGGLNFRKEGPLQNKIMSSAIEAIGHYLAHGPMQLKPVDSPFVRLFFAKVSQESFNKYLNDLKKVHEDFSAMALRDRRYLNKEDLIDATWLLGLANCHGLDLIHHNK